MTTRYVCVCSTYLAPSESTKVLERDVGEGKVLGQMCEAEAMERLIRLGRVLGNHLAALCHNCVKYECRMVSQFGAV